MKELYQIHAEMCKVFSNSIRLEILNLLRDKEMSVTELIKKTKLSQANISQHLSAPPTFNFSVSLQHVAVLSPPHLLREHVPVHSIQSLVPPADTRNRNTKNIRKIKLIK